MKITITIGIIVFVVICIAVFGILAFRPKYLKTVKTTTRIVNGRTYRIKLHKYYDNFFESVVIKFRIREVMPNGKLRYVGSRTWIAKTAWFPLERILIATIEEDQDENKRGTRRADREWDLI